MRSSASRGLGRCESHDPITRRRRDRRRGDHLGPHAKRDVGSNRRGRTIDAPRCARFGRPGPAVFASRQPDRLRARAAHRRGRRAEAWAAGAGRRDRLGAAPHRLCALCGPDGARGPLGQGRAMAGDGDRPPRRDAQRRTRTDGVGLLWATAAASARAGSVDRHGRGGPVLNSQRVSSQPAGAAVTRARTRVSAAATASLRRAAPLLGRASGLGPAGICGLEAWSDAALTSRFMSARSRQVFGQNQRRRC